ncbi:Mariner Mos1 transposase [Eumeta japonica]|uniref:Mariner Mos1 transposase n=1 Tax=Eumeta variegata TaxID=151549 RepID=A0A4C1T5E1_EUMVA|nr:Mariner Mos1 transposase [Eumeta japonica]
MTFCNWFAEFICGRVNSSKEFHNYFISRQSTALNNENIDPVRRIIETDRHVIYNEIRVSSVIEELRKNNRKRQIILRHDNVSSHTAKQSNKFLKEENLELMSNSAYSSDLAPFDLILFTKIKNQLRGQPLSSPEGAVEEYEKHVSEVTREEWHKCFQN